MSKQRATNKPKPGFRFEAVKIDSLFEALDAVAWLDSPGTKEIAQYADLDPRSAVNVNLTVDSSSDPDKLEKQLKLLKQYGLLE